MPKCVRCKRESDYYEHYDWALIVKEDRNSITVAKPGDLTYSADSRLYWADDSRHMAGLCPACLLTESQIENMK
jgi:hypothetical protein